MSDKELLKECLKFFTVLANKGYNEYAWRECCGLEQQCLENLGINQEEYIKETLKL